MNILHPSFRQKFALVFITLAFVYFNSCDRKRINDEFSAFVQKYTHEYLKTYPVTASLLGYHDHDDLLDDWDINSINERTKNLFQFQKRLQSIDSSLLTEQNKLDYLILNNQIKSEFWELKTYRGWEVDATFYNNIYKQSITKLLNRNPDSAKHICKNLYSRLTQFPRLIKQQKTNMTKPKEHSVRKAVEQLTSLKYLLTSEITKTANQCPDFKDSLLSMHNQVNDSLALLRQYLEKSILTISGKNNAAGIDLYQYILQNRYFINDDLTEILKEIENEIQWCQQQIDDISNELYQKLFRKKPEYLSTKMIREKVLEKIADNYTQNDMLIDKTNEIIDDIDQFLNLKTFIQPQVDYQIEVTRSNEWNNDFELAYLDAPGPFDKNDSYLFVLKSPSDEMNWLDQLSFLRNFNKSMLQVLTIQNLLPGKLLILSKFNKHPSMVRKIFQDQCFIEGWPFQAGFIMINAGFGGYDQQIRLVHLITYLQATVSAFIDIKFHLNQVTEAEAINISIYEGLMNYSQAQNQILKILLKPGSLIVPVWGYLQLKQLYLECQILEKNYFSHTKFWARLHNEGALPISLLRKKIIKDIKNEIKNKQFRSNNYETKRRD